MSLVFILNVINYTNSLIRAVNQYVYELFLINKAIFIAINYRS